jgi:hypothetical protein
MTVKDLTDDELIKRIDETYGPPGHFSPDEADVAELIRRYRVAKWCRLAESKFRAAIAAGFTPPKEEVTP